MEFTIRSFDAQQPRSEVPRKSLVQIRFPDSAATLTYYNDRFDLKAGDLVYVDGKLAGQMGCVKTISYNFRIKLSDYQKVIAVVDTDVHGKFHMAHSHFVTFDPAALSAKQALSWFRAPVQEDEEIICCTDGSAFPLEDLKALSLPLHIARRGYDYYLENRVRYLCIDGTKGFAIVEGSKAYTVEFEYQDGQIRNLLCDCPCSCACKHEFAALLQLKETLALIESRYSAEFEKSGCFAAILKSTLFTVSIYGKETGSITI